MFLHRRFLFNLFKYKRKLLKQELSHVKCFATTVASNSRLPRILFFGTDSFSLPSFKILHNSNLELGAVTSFKNPANCIRQYAEQHNLPCYKWPISNEICQNYELGVVVSFGHMIPTKIIRSLPLGMINVHASLLPRWRGAAPIIYALMHGDTETGVSIMKIEPKHFDIGDILAQARVSIDENCVMPQLHSTLANKGAELLLEVVQTYTEKLQHAKKQDEHLVTYAPKITPAVTVVIWSELSAPQIYNRYRALLGFKNLLTRFQAHQVQLIEIRVADRDVQQKAIATLSSYKTPGSFLYSYKRKSLLVRCQNDTFIEILQLRVEGKKVMSAQDFNNGFLKKLKNLDASCFVDNKSLTAFS